MGKSIRSKVMKKHRAELRRTVCAPVVAARQEKVQRRLEAAMAGAEPGKTMGNLGAVLAGGAPSSFMEEDGAPKKFSFKDIFVAEATPVYSAHKHNAAKAAELAERREAQVIAMSTEGSGKAPRKAQVARAQRTSGYMEMFPRKGKGYKNTVSRSNGRRDQHASQGSSHGGN